MPRVKDYTGQRVGRLEALEAVYLQGRRTWLWRCHACGRKVVIHPNDTRGCQSCGCVHDDGMHAAVRRRHAGKAERYWQARQQGRTLLSIAEEFGVSEQAVSWTIRDYARRTGRKVPGRVPTNGRRTR